MTSIHYFPRYSQPENFVTNNTLLLLSRLHEFNRFKFGKLLSMLCSDNDVDVPDIGMQFRQQVRTSSSVVDGYISQQSFYLAVETKLGETFGVGQLKRHLSIFQEGREQQYLLLLSKSDTPLTSLQHTSLNHAVPKGVAILQSSFETLIRYAKDCLSDFDEEMAALVLDFEAFCSSEKLLPTDAYTMFVPPCGRSFKENIKHQLYYCPSTWSRRKARFLGIYAGKEVRAVGEIIKIVTCNILHDQTVDVLEIEGPELSEEERARIVSVVKDAKTNNGWDISINTKFFLCSKMESTSFKKQSPGGIMGHRYFNLRLTLGSHLPERLIDLADQLKSVKWE